MAIPTPLASYNLNWNSNDAISANNGTDTSITYSPWNGKIIQWAWFNGSTSIILPPSWSIRPAWSFTVNAWIKTSTTGTAKWIFQTYSQLSPAVSWFQFAITSWNVLQIVSWKNTWYVLNTDYKALAGSTNVCTGNWTMVSGVYNWSTLELFVNWVSDWSVAWTNAPVYQADSKPSIGANRYDWTTTIDYFNWAIDIVDIWSSALTSTDLLYLYNWWAWREYPFLSGNSNFFLFF